jgi:alkylation response protein AidB-like acyl-CoA dehydrogenase
VDFRLSDEQKLLVDSTGQLLTRLSPIESVRQLAESGEDGYDRRVWQRGSELGWSALLVPEEHGGPGSDLVDLALIAEEHGRTVQPGPLLSHAIVTAAVAGSPNEDLRSAALPALVTGEATGAWAFAEHRQPWDASGVEALATRTAGGFRLTGIKTAVQDAESARWLLVTARLDGDLAQFLVPRDTPGITVRRQRTIDLTRRFDQVRFDDVDIPETALLYAPGAAADAVATQLCQGAVLISAESVGVGERLLDMSVDHAAQRVQFGRPIGSFQAVKHKCATMRMWWQASRAATYYAAMAMAGGVDDAAEAASVAKAYTSEAITKLAGEAVQIHGGVGFTWEHDVHLYVRRAKANQVVFGDPALHHERVITNLEQPAR